MAYRRSRFQFTSKKHSVPAGVGLGLGIASILVLFICIALAYGLKGEVPKPAVVFAVLAVIFSGVAVLLAVQSRKNKQVFMTLPNVSLVVGILGLVLWIVVYILGFIG